MTEKDRDFQLTGDDPMIEQIESATTGSDDAASREAGTEASPEATGDEGRPPAVEPGEPKSAQFEPDASQ